MTHTRFVRSFLLCAVLLLIGLPARAQGFFGTTTLLPFEISVNNERVLRLEPGTATDGPNVILGWSGNTVAPGVVGATISGGGDPDDVGPQPNRVEGIYGTVGGGLTNTAGSAFSTVGGGIKNTASGSRSTIGGGNFNTAGDSYSTVGGGAFNFASGRYSTVGGGGSNTASGDDSTVGGGNSNEASGEASIVPGGEENEARGAYSFAAGFHAVADHEGAFVWSDNSQPSSEPLVSTAVNQFLIRAAGGVGIGTDAPAAALEASNSTDTDADIILGGTADTGPGDNGILGSDPDYASSDLFFRSNDTVAFRLDTDQDGEDADFFVEDKDGNNLFNIDESGDVGIGTDAPTHPLEMASGAHVTAGGTWTNGSSRHFKEGFAPVDAEAILELVARLPVTRWRYKGSEEGAHLGPMAEDFRAAFGLGADGRYITTVDADGVALASIQGLYARNAALREQSARQQQEIADQRSALSTQEAEIEALKARLATLEAALARIASASQEESAAAKR